MYSIKRHIEPVILKRAKNNKAILLTGPRQVGKSTLFKYLFNNVNQVTFDDDLLLSQAENDIGLFLLNNPCPLMIDEVQKCPGIFNKIKIILDKTDQYSNFYLTGSQKMDLIENSSESLAGRVSVVELEGLSLREIYDIDYTHHFVPTADYLSSRDPCGYQLDNRVHRHTRRLVPGTAGFVFSEYCPPARRLVASPGQGSTPLGYSGRLSCRQPFGGIQEFPGSNDPSFCRRGKRISGQPFDPGKSVASLWR